MLSIYYKGSLEWLALLYASTPRTDFYIFLVQVYGVCVHVLYQ